jgi:hypothetical protein
MTQHKQKTRIVFTKVKSPRWRQSLSAPKTRLEVEKSWSFYGDTIFPTDFNDRRELYETLMAAAGRILAVTWA